MRNVRSRLGWIFLTQVCAFSPPAQPQVSTAVFERLEVFGKTGPAVPGAGAFDVLATDMDLDGDPDLLINWHHLRSLELFENREGRFEWTNPPGEDESGLYDNPDIPYLFSSWAEISPRIRPTSTPGLYLWHDQDRRQCWRFRWVDPSSRYDGLSLELEASLGIGAIQDLESEEFEELGPRQLRVSVKSGAQARDFRVQVRGIATGLVLRRSGSPARERPPLFVGSELTRIEADVLQIWKPDPHGIAWVNVEGTPHPEVFITRGASGGNLQRHAQPKTDRYYVGGDTGPNLYRMMDPGVVPPGYGRGRKLEWVDIDNNEALELSVGNKETPNALLERDPSSGNFVDRAAEYGLASPATDVHTWGDLDGDTLQDLYYLEGKEVHVARNRGDKSFERLTGQSLGLVLPDRKPQKRRFDPTSLRLNDFDNDGDLDLWVLAYGSQGSNHIFCRDGDGFTDLSDSVGLSAVRGTKTVVLLDVDNDGFEDAVSFGAGKALLWQNLYGKKFNVLELSKTTIPESIDTATALDMDSDGRTDLAVVGKQPYLLRNITDSPNGFLTVALRSQGCEPIGAVIRAHFSNGMKIARRHGSTHSSSCSQTVQPLHFGIRKGLELQTISVRWPGHRETTTLPVKAINQTLWIDRP